MFVLSIAILLAGAAVGALTAAIPRISAAVSRAALIAGCAAGAAAAAFGTGTAGASWPLPLARLSVAVDPLSGFFLVTIMGICLAAGLFGEAYARRSEELSTSRSIRPLFLLLTASLAVVVCARNAVLFLFAWELMALASFFLIVIEDKKTDVRRAGLLYFACTHTATLALFLLFALLGRASGSLDFDAMRAALPSDAGNSGVLLTLALTAFGTKAGIAPFHIWLQEAHPAAPSHVSAVMSGVVIKVGIYGLLRLIWLLRGVPDFWAVTLILAGAVSGVGGVVFALAQHDLKRLLAYHSVENIGIITLGMGLGCLGLSHHRPELALLGFAGAVLHTLNHALFKSLLFLGSGSFAQALGTRDLEAGGGLLKAMPWTSALSLAGAAAISGIPPLNGFVSEWLVYLACLAALSADARLSAASIGALALIGGLALACFTKAYGTLCLGTARTASAQTARDPGVGMLAPMAALAAVCGAIGLFPGPFVGLAAGAAAVVCGLSPEAGRGLLGDAIGGARFIGATGVVVLALGASLALLRSRLLPRERVSRGPTWGCGFTAPTPRLQYTASSLAQPLTRVFEPVLCVQTHAAAPAGYWPQKASFSTHTQDQILDGLLLPLGSGSVAGLAWLKRRQRSRLQYYMLYAALFLIALFLWKL